MYTIIGFALFLTGLLFAIVDSTPLAWSLLAHSLAFAAVFFGGMVMLLRTSPGEPTTRLAAAFGGCFLPIAFYASCAGFLNPFDLTSTVALGLVVVALLSTL